MKYCNPNTDPDPQTDPDPNTITAIINQIKTSSVVVYPNPCSGQFRVRYPDSVPGEKCEMRISNSTGQIVAKKKNVLAQPEMIMDVIVVCVGAICICAAIQ